MKWWGWLLSLLPAVGGILIAFLATNEIITNPVLFLRGKFAVTRHSAFIVPKRFSKFASDILISDMHGIILINDASVEVELCARYRVTL